MIPPAVRTIKYRASIIDLVEQLNPALAITLAFNRDTTPAGAAEDLKHLHARLDRLVLGRLWAKRVDDRSTYVAVIEHVDTNLHIHLALSCAPEHVDQIASAVAGIWKEMVPTGSVVLKDASDIPGGGPIHREGYHAANLRSAPHVIGAGPIG